MSVLWMPYRPFLVATFPVKDDVETFVKIPSRPFLKTRLS